MKKMLKAIIALTAIGVAVRAKDKKHKKFSVTITSIDDELLADITEENIIFHKDVNVYFNNQLVN